MGTKDIDVLWWNVQRLFRPHGPGEARALGLSVELEAISEERCPSIALSAARHRSDREVE